MQEREEDIEMKNGNTHEQGECQRIRIASKEKHTWEIM